MTTAPTRYRPRKFLDYVATELGMAVPQLMLASGLPRPLCSDPNPTLSAAQFFTVWETADRLVPGGITVDQARMAVRRSISPQTYAFSASPNVQTGFERLAIFKPLTGPIALYLSRDADTLKITVDSPDPTAPFPARIYGVEIVHLIELMRMATLHRIVPLAVSFPSTNDRLDDVSAFAGCKVDVGVELSITLSAEDADRPLHSANKDQWEAFEPLLRGELAALNRCQTHADRTRAALFELMPAGRASIEDVAARLGLSKRSLQRHLSQESSSFGTVLQSVRQDLATHYLTEDDLRIEEISHLLAFRDPNSFYRAFQSWTGMTPKSARAASRRS